MNHNKFRALIFLVVEMLGVASFAANFFLTDLYLQGRFTKDIPDVLVNTFTLDKIDAKYDMMFPKVSI